MAIFPLLSSGAVAQYPAALSNGQATRVVRFLDGSDQRYLTQGRSYRQWRIRLDLLNEAEIAQLEDFFSAQQGDFSTFVFPDPISGIDVPNCRLASGGFVSLYVGVDVSSTSLVVMETNG